MRFKAVLMIALLAFVALTTGCAYSYQPLDREPVGATEPVALPDWPDGQLIVCPRGNWDPEARCPSGSEWIGYDSQAADTLQEYAIAADANTEIAGLQVEQIGALDDEAAAANDRAYALREQLGRAEMRRQTERLGWIVTLAGVIALGL